MSSERPPVGLCHFPQLSSILSTALTSIISALAASSQSMSVYSVSSHVSSPTCSAACVGRMSELPKSIILSVSTGAPGSKSQCLGVHET